MYAATMKKVSGKKRHKGQLDSKRNETAEESEARKIGLSERMIEIKNKENIRRIWRENEYCGGALIEFLQDISLTECGDTAGESSR